MAPSKDRRERDPFEDDYAPSVFSRGLDVLVPKPVARLAVDVDIQVDRDGFASDEPISFQVQIRNRLPLPIEVPIANQRVWWWAVDGLREASEERTYEPVGERSLALRAGETRVYEHTWHGRIKRTNSRTTYEPLTPGTHELSVVLGTDPPKTASTSLTIG